MKIFTFDFLSYPYLPDDYNGPAWTVCPNSFFDPVRGHKLYADAVDRMAATEALGFDGVAVNEHHQTPYANMPSPNLMAAALIQRTKTSKICVLGDALPLYNPPLRVAEEYAILDVMSGGRLMAGMVPGDQPGYYAHQVNPSEARARFAEALDLTIQAWTRPGPFEFYGEYYQIPNVNPWPLPYQKPHPPIWIPGVGSPETHTMVSERRLHYASLPFFPRPVVNANFRSFRSAWLKAGNAPDPDHLGMVIPVYVAKDDATARQEFEQHYAFFRDRLQNGSATFAPGYTSAPSLLRMMKAMQVGKMPQTWEEITGEDGFLAVGSPQRVIDRLSSQARETGIGNLFVLTTIGSLPQELAMKNQQMFAENVMPALRQAFPEGATWNEIERIAA